LSYRYGRLAAQFPAAVSDLTHYAAGPLPKAPAKVAVPAVADWGMLGNDRYGDCGVAGLEHGFMADAAVLGLNEPPAADAQAIGYYLTYTDGADNGVVLSQYLAYVRQHGYFGHNVAAYAPVSVKDIPTLQFAVSAFDFAYTGIVVTQAMEEASADGRPWTLDDLDSPVAGGHCVPIVGYDTSYLYAVTWGTVQPIAYSAWHYIADEAWAVITGELTAANSDGRGIALPALQADLSRLEA